MLKRLFKKNAHVFLLGISLTFACEHGLAQSNTPNTKPWPSLLPAPNSKYICFRDKKQLDILLKDPIFQRENKPSRLQEVLERFGGIDSLIGRYIFLGSIDGSKIQHDDAWKLGFMPPLTIRVENKTNLFYSTIMRRKEYFRLCWHNQLTRQHSALFLVFKPHVFEGWDAVAIWPEDAFEIPDKTLIKLNQSAIKKKIFIGMDLFGWQPFIAGRL